MMNHILIDRGCGGEAGGGKGQYGASAERTETAWEAAEERELEGAAKGGVEGLGWWRHGKEDEGEAGRRFTHRAHGLTQMGLSRFVTLFFLKNV